jgi:hypothetical protein
MMTRQRYESAAKFAEFIERAESNQELWRSVYDRVQLPAELVDRASQLPARHLAVLAEDWCGDAVNTVPVLARLAEAVPGMSLRLFPRDLNADLMDAHLTEGARAIPVVIVLDEDFREVTWWGPRPLPLQAWVTTDGQELARDERYREMRRWYARDRGRSTLEEVVARMEHTAMQVA